MNQDDLLKTGANCWRAETATHAAMVVDCANYYRALHSAICKAKHSIFILGWDIDSRIELLRGKDAEEAGCPSVFFDLIQWKARQSPDVMIYLNRWNYSIAALPSRSIPPGWRRRITAGGARQPITGRRIGTYGAKSGFPFCYRKTRCRA